MFCGADVGANVLRVFVWDVNVRLMSYQLISHPWTLMQWMLLVHAQLS